MFSGSVVLTLLGKDQETSTPLSWECWASLSPVLNFTRGQKDSSHLHPTDLRLLVAQAVFNLLIARAGSVNAAGAVSCPQVSPVHKVSCSSLALSKDARYLLTAGDKVIKVWDYQMRFDINFQVLHTRGGKQLGIALTCQIKHFSIPGEKNSR